MGIEAQLHRLQTAKHEIDIVHADAEAKAHVRRQNTFIEFDIACNYRPHQNIRSATLILGQRLHRDINAELERFQS